MAYPCIVGFRKVVDKLVDGFLEGLELFFFNLALVIGFVKVFY